MENYLEKTCIHLGIKLVYTNNKVVALSAEVRNNIPIIRAHKVFKSCPAAVAQAAIDYYIDLNDRAKHEKVLVQYLNQKFTSNLFKIKPLNIDFKKEIVQNLPSSNMTEDDATLVELPIASMSVKDFWGEEKRYNHNSPVIPSNDDILELNIVIKPPVT